MGQKVQSVAPEPIAVSVVNLEQVRVQFKVDEFRVAHRVLFSGTASSAGMEFEMRTCGHTFQQSWVSNK
jgi:hypothetical protein